MELTPTPTPTPTPKKRAKSPARKALEASVSEFDELLASDALDKASKRADVLMAKAGVIRELLALEAADRDTEMQDTIDRLEGRLEGQRTADSRRIAGLEAENRNLRDRPVEVKTELDPEHATTRTQNERLAALLKFVTQSLTDTERSQMAIRAIQTLTPDHARAFCDFVGVDYKAYWQMLRWTEAELDDVINKARSGSEGDAVVFAKARLAVRDAARHGTVTVPSESSGFIPDTMSADEKLAAAKASVRQPRAAPKYKTEEDL